AVRAARRSAHRRARPPPRGGGTGRVSRLSSTARGAGAGARVRALDSTSGRSRNRGAARQAGDHQKLRPQGAGRVAARLPALALARRGEEILDPSVKAYYLARMISAAMNFTAAFPIGFLFGSIPFGVIFARLRGVNLRNVGSGNIGATNAARALGRGWGAL